MVQFNLPVRSRGLEFPMRYSSDIKLSLPENTSPLEISLLLETGFDEFNLPK
jgi:hypothetical protein